MRNGHNEIAEGIRHNENDRRLDLNNDYQAGDCTTSESSLYNKGSGKVPLVRLKPTGGKGR